MPARSARANAFLQLLAERVVDREPAGALDQEHQRDDRRCTREYSHAALGQKNPLADVAQMALIMKIKIAAAAKRVRKPNASMRPPRLSVRATRVSQNTAGCQPILSKKLGELLEARPTEPTEQFLAAVRDQNQSQVTNRNSGSAIGSNAA